MRKTKEQKQALEIAKKDGGVLKYTTIKFFNRWGLFVGDILVHDWSSLHLATKYCRKHGITILRKEKGEIIQYK